MDIESIFIENRESLKINNRAFSIIQNVKLKIVFCLEEEEVGYIDFIVSSNSCHFEYIEVVDVFQ